MPNKMLTDLFLALVDIFWSKPVILVIWLAGNSPDCKPDDSVPVMCNFFRNYLTVQTYLSSLEPTGVFMCPSAGRYSLRKGRLLILDLMK